MKYQFLMLGTLVGFAACHPNQFTGGSPAYQAQPTVTSPNEGDTNNSNGVSTGTGVGTSNPLPVVPGRVDGPITENPVGGGTIVGSQPVTDPLPFTPKPIVTQPPQIYQQNPQITSRDVYIHCADEAASAGQNISVGTAGVVANFYVDPFCATTMSATVPNTLVDIVFVFDTATNVMHDPSNPSLTNVKYWPYNDMKTAMGDAARALEADGLNARFAAIGFRKETDNTPGYPPTNMDSGVSFTNASGLIQGLSSWVAYSPDNNEYPPQAGLLALSKAMDMLTADYNSNPSRRSAEKAIVYIDQNLADMKLELPHNFYLDGPHGTIASKFSATLAAIPQLQFYFSAADTNWHDVEVNASAPASVQDEMISLRAKSGVPGKNYSYPFTANSRSQFVTDFIASLRTVQQQISGSCYPATATLSTTKGTVGSFSASSLSATNYATSDNGEIQVNTNDITSFGTYNLNVSRCCVPNFAAGPYACVSTHSYHNTISISQ